MFSDKYCQSVARLNNLIDCFADWSAWRAEGQHMVSPGGRKLKRETWERMKAESEQKAQQKAQQKESKPKAESKSKAQQKPKVEWSEQGDYMVSSGGRRLKKETWERLFGSKESSKPEVKTNESADRTSDRTSDRTRSVGSGDGSDQSADRSATRRTGTPKIITAREELTVRANHGRIPEKFREHLSEAQKDGVALGIQSLEDNGVFLNADGTGVGKSRQQLAVAGHFLEQGKNVVIVAPAGVIKPNWQKNEIDPNNSFAKDSKLMGLEVHLTRGDQLKSGVVNLTTYENLKDLKNRVDQNTVVLFDEAHNLKNKDTARFEHAKPIMDKAFAVGHYTATPADKPLHTAYLMAAGSLGHRPFSEVAQELGMHLVEVRTSSGEYVKTWKPQPGVTKAEIARRINGLFDQMTKEGLMIKRELSLDGVEVSTDRVQLSDSALGEVEKAYRDQYRKTGNRAVALMAAREAQEKYKIPAVVDSVKRQLAEGRQAVVFVGTCLLYTSPSPRDS